MLFLLLIITVTSDIHKVLNIFRVFTFMISCNPQSTLGNLDKKRLNELVKIWFENADTLNKLHCFLFLIVILWDPFSQCSNEYQTGPEICIKIWVRGSLFPEFFFLLKAYL